MDEQIEKIKNKEISTYSGCSEYDASLVIAKAVIYLADMLFKAIIYLADRPHKRNF